MMRYKGYFGQANYDEEANIFFGTVLYLEKTIITFQSESIENIKQEFINSIDDYLAWMKERNEEPEKTNFDTISLQIPRNLYEKLDAYAKNFGENLDSYILETIESIES